MGVSKIGIRVALLMNLKTKYPKIFIENVEQLQNYLENVNQKLKKPDIWIKNVLQNMQNEEIKCVDLLQNLSSSNFLSVGVETIGAQKLIRSSLCSSQEHDKFSSSQVDLDPIFLQNNEIVRAAYYYLING